MSLQAPPASPITLERVRSRKRHKLWQFLRRFRWLLRKNHQFNSFPPYKISSRPSMPAENMCLKQLKEPLLLTRSAKSQSFRKSTFRNSQPCSSCLQLSVVNLLQKLKKNQLFRLRLMTSTPCRIYSRL